MHTANAARSSRWLLQNTFHYADLIRVQYIRFSEGCKGRTFVPLGFILLWTHCRTGASIPRAQGRRTHRPTAGPGRTRSPGGGKSCRRAPGRCTAPSRSACALPPRPPAGCRSIHTKKARHGVLINSPEGQRPIFLHPGDGGKSIRRPDRLSRSAPSGAHRFSRHSSRMDWRGAVPAKEVLTRTSPQR